MIKTHYTTPSEVVPAWHVIDAEGKVLGRLATKIATVLRGKHKPTYSQCVDTGDHVIVVNADKIVLTRNKGEQKVYRRYSGYPGGLKETSFNEMIEKHPERVIEAAVRGMLPKSRLGRAQIKKLKIYAGPEHKHDAQNPQPLEI
ncbi:MAG: 50S ribosomal protein L13 [Candidatus Omnitrophica bacterium]|nr:50S ribosomal protein L13 [Candidatus Omnitrophota bacterium]MCA9416806.1 50S ribosomal protein L13 [Candidatus Omnitrophota bacterium]MCA9432587.1 50S ribosomal protein L13 [Candidatus Omnitrophota bacterium]MCA9435740.1 50S ribosomal protein L13 [Candidatus Omnitrophota bacterium]MCA9439762.1 50S ribosomal protein L13 [Candidatus Omnitrophota bacterium]